MDGHAVGVSLQLHQARELYQVEERRGGARKTTDGPHYSGGILGLSDCVVCACY